MRKRKSRHTVETQGVLFPPALSQDHFALWRRLKGWYATHLVFFIPDGYYVTMGDDADLAGQASGRTPDRGDGWEGIIFSPRAFEELMACLTLNGRVIAICDPPEDPTMHVFT